jgi:hypothetical protein
VRQKQIEFLIRLAPIYLACRLRVMGGSLSGQWPRQDLAFDMLGMFDYAHEMKLLCAEMRGSLNASNR